MSVTIEEIRGAWEILLETEQGWPEWDELDDKRQEVVCKASWEAREEDPGADLIDVPVRGGQAGSMAGSTEGSTEGSMTPGPA